MKPIINFTERRGLVKDSSRLIGEVTLHVEFTIPSYGDRRLAEQYIEGQFQDEWVKLRGYHKLIDARNEIVHNINNMNYVASNIALKVIDELIHELKQPQFEIKGEKPRCK